MMPTTAATTAKAPLPARFASAQPAAAPRLASALRAFNLYADAEREGPLAFLRRATAGPVEALKMAAPVAPLVPRRPAALKPSAEDGQQQQQQQPALRFRSALEQVSYFTNQSAFNSQQ